MSAKSARYILGFSACLLSQQCFAAVYLMARDLTNPLLKPFFTHTYLQVVPDNPEDFQGNTSWTMSAYSTRFNRDNPAESNRLGHGINYERDANVPPEDVQNVWQVPTPPGKTDTEFINDLLSVAGRYPQNSRKYVREGNSNDYTTSLLVGTGVSSSFIDNVDTKKYAPGFGRVFPEMMSGYSYYADGYANAPSHTPRYATSTSGSSYESEYGPSRFDYSSGSSDYGSGYGDYSGSSSDYSSRDYDRSEHFSERVSERVSDFSERVSDRVSDLSDRVSDRLSDMADSIRDRFDR